MAKWTERLTRKGQTRVRNWKDVNILLSQLYNTSEFTVVHAYMHSCPLSLLI